MCYTGIWSTWLSQTNWLPYDIVFRKPPPRTYKSTVLGYLPAVDCSESRVAAPRLVSRTLRRRTMRNFQKKEARDLVSEAPCFEIGDMVLAILQYPPTGSTCLSTT